MPSRTTRSRSCLYRPRIARPLAIALDAFVALCRAENVRTRFDIEEGTPASAILEAAEQHDADLICLGTHGREGFERLVLGSIAEKVMRKASCPVLTVSEPGQEDAIESALFKNILCAVDFAPQSLNAVSWALSLAQEAQGRLILVNALEYFALDAAMDGDATLAEYRDRMEESVYERLEALVPEDARAWCEPEYVVRTGKPYRIALELAEERDVDLVVMGVRGRNPLDRALFGSNTEHVVRRAPCPVLTVRGGEA